MSQADAADRAVSPGKVPSGASVEVASGFYEGLEVPIDRDWLVVGRGRSADLVIAEPTISRAHAALGFDAEGFFVLPVEPGNYELVITAPGHAAQNRSVRVERGGGTILNLDLEPEGQQP